MSLMRGAGRMRRRAIGSSMTVVRGCGSGSGSGSGFFRLRWGGFFLTAALGFAFGFDFGFDFGFGLAALTGLLDFFLDLVTLVFGW
jgi:hypothetical protein